MAETAADGERDETMRIEAWNCVGMAMWCTASDELRDERSHASVTAALPPVPQPLLPVIEPDVAGCYRGRRYSNGDPIPSRSFTYVTTVDSATFHLRVLGAPQLIDQEGQSPQGLGWGKPLALLIYLALRGEVRRDEIVDLLWRDVEES